MDRQTDGWMNGKSPIGAAALPPPMKTKEKVQQGKGTADHLMPLGYLFNKYFFLFLGCNLNKSTEVWFSRCPLLVYMHNASGKLMNLIN